MGKELAIVMNQIVNSFVEKHELIKENDHIIIAVSGGPDSMALLHYLMEQKEWKIQISAAHVEHGLRGEASILDMELVESFCESRQIPFYYHQPNIKQVMKEKGYSLQEAARYSRYTWLEKLMLELDASSVALAHHGDDQVETVLMKLVRGGLSSLQGIPVTRPFANGKIIRPFLCLEKLEIIKYCQENGVEFRLDESNEKDAYQRNRFRKTVLPFLKEENTNVHQIFQRQSEWTREENHFLQTEAEKAFEQVILKKKEGWVELCNKSFLLTPIPLQRRGLHLILNYLSVDVGRYITSKHIDDIILLIKSKSPSKEVHLPAKIIVKKAYDKCLLMVNGMTNGGFSPIMIPLTGIVPLKQGKITSEVVRNASSFFKKDTSVFLGDLSRLATPLYVRTRLEGDRIIPIGMDGSKKVKKIFIEEKIPVMLRDSWPIVTDRDGKVIWIPHLKRSDVALIDERTEEAVKLEYEKKE
ncbi:MAG: tRNA lysidine(34) synthetase TilS [Bacillus sp. (in: Bacteria)]|nr:tRNA lysidine(34) synthetase TilS [Bacillus sp. (in: firmicutes)]